MIEISCETGIPFSVLAAEPEVVIVSYTEKLARRAQAAAKAQRGGR